MLSIIVAYDKNRVIGYKNKMPWHLPADLERLRMLTTGKTIVMGKNTFLSINRVLPLRTSIVLTTDITWQNPGVQVVHSLAEVLRQYEQAQTEWFIFGGGEIFCQFLPFVEQIYATEICYEFIGDCFFPSLDLSEWQIKAQQLQLPDENNKYEYKYVTYVRR